MFFCQHQKLTLSLEPAHLTEVAGISLSDSVFMLRRLEIVLWYDGTLRESDV